MPRDLSLERAAAAPPQISVVVPSLNQGHFIRQTIDSILSQGIEGIEVFVVDGGSTDGTLDILAEYGSALSWTSESDRGQSHAINKGFARASGEIVCFLNSDDFFEPGALRAVVDHFRANPNCEWLFGRCKIVDERGKPIRSFVERYKRFWSKYVRSAQSLKILNYIPQPATFWKSRLIREVGPINEALYYAMDYDLWLRFSKRSQPHYLDRFLSNFRIHGSSKSLNGARKQLREAQATASRHGAGAFSILHLVHDALTLALYRSLYGQSVVKTGAK